MKNIHLVLRLALAALFFIVSTGGFAADKDSLKTWADLYRTFKTEKLQLAWVKPAIDTNLIMEMEVVDMRPDTERIGMYANALSQPTAIVLADGKYLASALPQKLVNPNSPGCSLLMIVRDFWMSGIKAKYAAPAENNHRGILQTSKVVYQVDVFLKQDNKYLPLVRIDTTIWDKKSLVKVIEPLFEKALENIHLQISAALKKPGYLSRRKEERKTIIEHYYNSSAHLNGTLPKKGVYTTFKQFKQNEPMPDNFVIKNNHDEPLSLFMVDDKGNETLSRNVWGVCDGENMYIMENSLIFKLYQNANAFYWIGLKQYDQKTYGAPAAVPLGGGWAAVGLENVASSVKVRLTPKLLNMTTGEEY